MTPTQLNAAVLLAMLLAATPASTHAQATFSAGPLTLALDQQGALTALRNTKSGRNYIAPGAAAPLVTLVSGGKRYRPTAMRTQRTPAGTVITLQFAEAGARIAVRIQEKPTHLTLEITSATPMGAVDAIVWGPYPTVIATTIGEVIGVVRDGDVALGMQVLNAKTLGGNFPNSEGSTWDRGIAATRIPGGSSLQAYAINRDRERRVDAWGGNFKDMPVSPIKGETVVGSAIALFTCPEAETLDELERIELAEHLPHPTIDGVWFRKSALYQKSYMISSFGEADVDEMIAYTKRAGLVSLYHEGPFSSWGHFVLAEAQFPGGRQGMKRAADKAHAAGLRLGVHTLTNFINTNDPYVTPVPDDRLSVTGTSTLVKEIDAGQADIEVGAPTFFDDQKNNSLHTVKIGAELIQYRAVTSTAPYVLVDCQRGAFGTVASSHPRGATVGKLLDHAYKVFFPNFAMQREVASNLAAFLNETGVDHIDFDGHEGGLASGQGDYAVTLFAEDVLSQVTHPLINGTSISKTFYWHMGSYYNWGEPWNGGFTESMQQYRIDNQALFDRNYMPHMLGWYLLTATTTLAEMEWMLARAAGYGAGFAMVARPQALRTNPLTPALLDAIREWERARTTHAFTPAQEAQLKNPKNEFHLEKSAEDHWNLAQYAVSPVFTRAQVERQPGEPTHTTWNVTQEWAAQRLQFRLHVQGTGGSARAFRLRVDQYVEIDLPVELAAGESLVCDGSATVQVYDKRGRPRASVRLVAAPPVVAPGAHTITLDSGFSGDDPPRVEVQFKGLSRSDAIAARR